MIYCDTVNVANNPVKKKSPLKENSWEAAKTFQLKFHVSSKASVPFSMLAFHIPLPSHKPLFFQSNLKVKKQQQIKKNLLRNQKFPLWMNRYRQHVSDQQNIFHLWTKQCRPSLCFTWVDDFTFCPSCVKSSVWRWYFHPPYNYLAFVL